MRDVVRDQQAARARRPLHLAAGLPALALGSAAFFLLLVLVVSEWAPLRELDQSASLALNRLVAGSQALAGGLRAVTDLGDPLVTVCLLGVLTVVLLLRRLHRLAAWVAVTGLGLAVLHPLVKQLVGRERPVLPVEVATAPGQSFPSGHALASATTVAVVLLVALPLVPRRSRPWAVLGEAAVVLSVGATRVALGVHYVTDVVAGWALASAWVATTAFALRVRQVEQGEQPPRLVEGLEPRAAAALQPAPRGGNPLGPRPARTALLLAAGLLLVAAAVALVGWLVTDVLRDTWVGRVDHAVVRAVATLGVPALDPVAAAVNALGGTRVVLAVGLAAAAVSVAAVRRWRPALFLLVSMVGEVVVYLLVSRVLVPRARPAVGIPQEDLPELASFPSGHVAAAMTLYGALALVVRAHARRRIGDLAVVAAVVLGLLVALGRLYRGVHFPTDVLASALLAVSWLTVTSRLVLWPVSGASPYGERRRSAGVATAARGSPP